MLIVLLYHRSVIDTSHASGWSTPSPEVLPADLVDSLGHVSTMLPVLRVLDLKPQQTGPARHSEGSVSAQGEAVAPERLGNAVGWNKAVCAAFVNMSALGDKLASLPISRIGTMWVIERKTGALLLTSAPAALYGGVRVDPGSTSVVGADSVFNQSWIYVRRSSSPVLRGLNEVLSSYEAAAPDGGLAAADGELDDVMSHCAAANSKDLNVLLGYDGSSSLSSASPPLDVWCRKLTVDEEAFHAHVMPLPSPPGTEHDWLLLVLTRDSDVDGHLNLHFRESLYLCLLIICISASVAWLYNHHVSKPLQLTTLFMKELHAIMPVTLDGVLSTSAIHRQQPAIGSPHGTPITNSQRYAALYRRWRATFLPEASALDIADRELDAARSGIDGVHTSRSVSSTDASAHSTAGFHSSNTSSTSNDAKATTKPDHVGGPNCPSNPGASTAVVDSFPTGILQFSELRSIQDAFGAMLLRVFRKARIVERVDEARRRFIRYIFHEVLQAAYSHCLISKLHGLICVLRGHT